MKVVEDNLLEDIQKCMTDPVSDVLQNFSLEKSRKFYKKHVEEWNADLYEANPVALHSVETFAFETLEEMGQQSKQAETMVYNLQGLAFVKWVKWEIRWKNIVVSWYRLKTFDEWLEFWLMDALELARSMPEDWARQILERKLGDWTYTNTAIHMYIEWVLTKKQLERLSKYEWYRSIEEWDLSEEVQKAKDALEDMEEENSKKDVTVLTLKM